MNNKKPGVQEEVKSEKDLNQGIKERSMPMKKATKVFIGTLGGALIGNSIFGLTQVVNYVASITSIQFATFLPLVGLILGGIVGYYVATSS